MNDVALRAEQGAKAIPSCAIDSQEFIAVINRSSGTGTPEQLIERLQQQAERVRIIDFVVVENGPDLETDIERQFSRAVEGGYAVLVAGGDGTLNIGVKYAHRYRVALAVMAQGTFNLFSRHHGLSTDPEQQVLQLSECRLQQVPVCWINGLPFTTSASFGLYPKVIEDRESYQEKMGFRSRATAFVAGMVTFLKQRRRVNLTVCSETGNRNIKALMLMVTQNRQHLLNLGFNETAEHIDGHFALVTVKPLSRLDKLRLLLKGSLKQLTHDKDIDLSLHQSITLFSAKDAVECALDGEVMKLQTPLHVKVEPRALSLFVPQQDAKERA
jgi:diacylglycerol kinase family enzyme